MNKQVSKQPSKYVSTSKLLNKQVGK